MKKKIFLILIVIFLLSLHSGSALADTVIDNGLNYLKSQQDEAGKITGFGGESQWAAIAFEKNGIAVSTVKQSDTSLKDFLLSDIPVSGASATEWERRILAIAAIGDDPTDFGGVNYVQNLESLANTNQIGDISLLNDDIFGLLALIASGPSANAQIKQDTLNFIISHQNSDGGFSWSTNPAFNSSDSNDTAAVIQALEAAKNDGLTNNNLEATIDNAKTYLLTLQTPDGGFKYDNSVWTTDPDGGSTAWSLMALNVLDLANSSEAEKARTWLTAQQEADGGFHWMNGYGSDTSTTSHALIALIGHGWLYQPTVTITITPALSPTPTATEAPSPTPTPTPTEGCQDTKPGSAPVITSAIISDRNKVTLTWTKASDPVSYYLIAYGTSQDSFEYGNPNVGGKETTGYTIGSLAPGVTYFFQVRAGNNCSPGDFSNTAIVTINTATPSPTPAVLGVMEQKENQPDSPVKNEVIAPQPEQNSVNINGGLIGFSLLLFLSAIGYWYFRLRG